jgi:hydrogenase-1 operon protein HyaF
MSHSSSHLRAVAPDFELEIDGALIESVLCRVGDALERLLDTGRSGAVDLRAVPQMSAATYRSLRDALGAGEVVATVEAESRVEVRETQYPGVWWVAHLNERGATVTELIEVTEIPAILKSHVDDMGTGLERLRRAVNDSGADRAQPTAAEPTLPERAGPSLPMAEQPQRAA